MKSYAGERASWALRHGWRTVRVRWGSIYDHGTELYLSAPAKGGVNLSALARRLAALGPAYSEASWPEAGSLGSQRGTASSKMFWDSEKFLEPVEIIEMSPELSAALKHQRDLDIAEAGPQAREDTVEHRGVTISSRWSIADELDTMRAIVDALPDLVRARVESMWCDSNAQAYYSVTIALGLWIEGIDQIIRAAVLSATDGFNGLIVESGENYVHFDPHWRGDEGKVDFA